MRRRDDCGVGNRRTGPKGESLLGWLSVLRRAMPRPRLRASRQQTSPSTTAARLCAMPIPVIVPCDHPFGMEAPADPPWRGMTMRIFIVCAILVTVAMGLGGCFWHGWHQQAVTTQPLK
jgi:hypothetical protein